MAKKAVLIWSNNIFKERFLTFAFCLIFLPGTYSVGQAANLLEEGNGYYKAGDFKNAIASYKNLTAEGYSGTSLYYNLGNAYYKTGKIGLAILNYERAKKLSPGDDDIEHNLSLANLLITDRIDTLPEFFLFQWWESLLSLFSITGWTYTAYFFFIMLLVSIAVYFFARNRIQQRAAFFSSIINILILIFCISILIVNLNRELGYKYGIVTEQVVIVKVSPDVQSPDTFVIHEGLKVKVEEKLDSWYKIRLEDGKVGWTELTVLQII